MTTVPPRRGAKGQALVLLVLALVAILAMTGLLVDGGLLFAQQRIAQNGADSSALAGALRVHDHLRGLGGTQQDVYGAIEAMATTNGLGDWTAQYTTFDGTPTGQSVINSSAPIPPGVWGVRVDGSRLASTTFSRVIGVESLEAAVAATALVGPLSLACPLSQDPCALLPITFPVTVSQCDGQGNLSGGTWIGAPPPPDDDYDYWPILGVEEMTDENLAILPLCKGSGESTGAYGFLDFDPRLNLQQEITGPLTVEVGVPDWYQIQTGTPNSVQDELEAYIGSAVLIPLHNQACRTKPDPLQDGSPGPCPEGQFGVDPQGNNTWYFIHTVAVFVLDRVHIQGNQVNHCANPPGSPTVPVTQGTGFLGCLKGWFTEYIYAGPVNPDPNFDPTTGVLGIQLVR